MKSFFDILKDILLKQSGGTLHEETEFNTLFSPFMLARYLSMRDDLMIYARIINKYQTVLEPYQIYQLAYKMIPKQRNGYIKYISKKKKK